MHRIVKKTLQYTGFLFLSLIVLLIAGISYLYFSADMQTPKHEQSMTTDKVIDIDSLHLRHYGDNFLRHSDSGLWELFVKGDAFQRGEAIGQLSSDLLHHQEKVFVDQIREIVPSDSYLKFLRFFIVLFNRNLGENVLEEYRDEIYGISLSCTHEYDFIGTPYERQLNYHSAHDLGHAMQDYMLVGCSSFATWGTQSADSSLLIGRNFDFYVGDAFAENKQVAFYVPEQGYRFASVGWPGMIGVLSGMNETGLTVTINAAKSAVPTGSATPISILTREILQYAATIDEAFAIAKKTGNIRLRIHIDRFCQRWQSRDYREISGENCAFHRKRSQSAHLHQPLPIGRIQQGRTKHGKYPHFRQPIPFCTINGTH